MLTIKNASTQTIEVFTQSGDLIRIRPRKKVCVEVLTEQMKNLIGKKLLKKVI